MPQLHCTAPTTHLPAGTPLLEPSSNEISPPAPRIFGLYYISHHGAKDFAFCNPFEILTQAFLYTLLCTRPMNQAIANCLHTVG